SVGFDWPGGHIQFGVWDFSEGNVAHNNTGAGVRFWNNSKKPHLVENYVSYNNEFAGIENGAYANSNRYFNVLLLNEVLVQNSSSSRLETDGGPGRFERLEIHAPAGQPAIEVRGHQLAPISRWE